MDDTQYAKVDLLIRQGKYPEAEKMLRDLLREAPQNMHYLYLLAEVSLQQDKYDEAQDITERAIALAPDSSLLYHTRARIAMCKNDLAEAEGFIEQAISLDPEDADYHALYANIELGRKNYGRALEVADHALSLEPDNLMALNTRSTALVKLNRKEESFQTIEGALREDPNNPYSHANYGWGLLEKGDHKKALEHFHEALKNDPGLELAQAGMLEALKAGNPLYRLFLKYSFWMSNLTSKYQWGVIIGFYIAFRLLRTLAAANEALRPYLVPLIILLSIVAFSTWVINPISNLFLRFNKYGNLLLDKKQKLSSTFVAISLGMCIPGLVLYAVSGKEPWLSLAIYGFGMMVPCGSMFDASRNGKALIIYTIAMAITGLAGVVVSFSSLELFNVFTIVFILGFVLFQWVANFLVIRASNY